MSTRIRYTGPLDGVVIRVGSETVEVSHRGEVDLSEHATKHEATKAAKAYVDTGDWTFVQRDTDRDAPASEEE